MLGVRARQRRPFRAPPVMDQRTCTFFFWSRSTSLETRTRESNRWASCFFEGAKPAGALKAPAWTSAQATGCDLESGSRKSISVLGSMSVFCLSVSPLFFLPSLLSVSLSLSPSETRYWRKGSDARVLQHVHALAQRHPRQSGET